MNEIEQRKTVVGVSQRRNEVIQILNRSFAGNLIEMDELESRIELAEKAKFIEDLDILIKDIPAAFLQPASVTKPDQHLPIFNHSIIMGDKKLTSNRLTDGSSIKIIMGSCLMDFRGMNLPHGVTEINFKLIMGSCTILIPPGLMVENEVKTIMGSVEEDNRIDSNGNKKDAVLRIKGKVIMGSLEIKVK